MKCSREGCGKPLAKGDRFYLAPPDQPKVLVPVCWKCKVELTTGMSVPEYRK